MSTHKYFDKICCVILAITLVLTILFMYAEAFGIQKASSALGYETRLFDTSRVHTINIVMDDWDAFIASCTDEEYVGCSVVIDNEAYKNVAIRAKGNTSLSNVQSYGNNRYSFKIEFDHYDSTASYYGLDKLSLNNIIQDNTYMKDYLTYQMMGYFGVSAPLCSYAQIFVNGEEWGLYLAVECVEESFLLRNYGYGYGKLYKPDSISMGGGRGNGGKFDMDDWKDNQEAADQSMDFPAQTRPGMQEGQNRPDNMEITLEQIRRIMESLDDTMLISAAELLGYESGEAMLSALNAANSVDSFLNGRTFSDILQRFGDQMGDGNMTKPDMNGGMNGAFGWNGGGMGSSDVALIYSDDQYDSYRNIFENAKIDITEPDKDRLIASLKKLNENSGIEDVVNVEEVIRYFVVHNFVCNFDSYTGSMIHNYYLYEEDGRLSMIPWDYNLAFGGFVGGSDATSLVNYPIDTPVSGGTTESRPMLAWIFESEEYTELYHQYFAEFISQYFDSGYFTEMMDDIQAMISPYIEKDPTKFCTYEEFEKGIDTLKAFCLLRAESINAQLDGTIASTSEEQDKETLIDASALVISDMGSMNGGKGGGMDRPEPNRQGQTLNMQNPDAQSGGQTAEISEQSGENQQGQGGTFPQAPDGSETGEMDPENTDGNLPPEQKEPQPLPDFNGDDRMQQPQDRGDMTEFPQGGNGQDFMLGKEMTRPDDNGGSTENQRDAAHTSSYIWLGVCGGVLLAGLLFVSLYKKRV